MKPNHLLYSMLVISALAVSSCAVPQMAQKTQNQDDVYGTKAQAVEYTAPPMQSAQNDDGTYNNQDQQGDDYYGSSDEYADMSYASRINRFYYGSPYLDYYDPIFYGGYGGYGGYGLGFGYAGGWGGYGGLGLGWGGGFGFGYGGFGGYGWGGYGGFYDGFYNPFYPFGFGYGYYGGLYGGYYGGYYGGFGGRYANYAPRGYYNGNGAAGRRSANSVGVARSRGNYSNGRAGYNGRTGYSQDSSKL